MLAKLDHLAEKYETLNTLISDPEVIQDQERWRGYMKAHAELDDVVSAYREYKQVVAEMDGAREILDEEKDPDLREMAEAELDELEVRRVKLEKRLRVLLLPKDPSDEKNVIMEIRAGTGGHEAALFAGDLLRMYLRYAERQGWRIEMLGANETDLGGFKEAVVLIEGRGAYSRLKFESGVHRVQRVPDTESSGRIHTSAATVAVLPEAEEVDVDIKPEEVRVDIFCSTGPGGQSVNTTQSAVRVTHIPTGIVVSCQDEKSQHKNRDKAMKVLRARILDKLMQEQQQEIASARKTQVGSGDRSQRIRTYNFPQNRMTDHRLNLTLYRLDELLQGSIEELVDALITADQAEKLKTMD
ncbi:MAG: peptide chain release factor 1 [Desulforudis sp.]|jgi:peptide chain release factor 1|nr:peptide chain release factor 1 [Clostridia bacterium]MDQ7792639.1 peptide chain release factor 1 [Clostridia bacterium]RJX19636.1 MAG: peptide chain release factor 1 [Desulforudis sp.]